MSLARCCLETAAKNGQAEVGATGFNPLVLVAGAGHLLEKHAETIRRLVRRARAAGHHLR